MGQLLACMCTPDVTVHTMYTSMEFAVDVENSCFVSSHTPTHFLTYYCSPICSNKSIRSVYDTRSTDLQFNSNGCYAQWYKMFGEEAMI